MGFQWECLGVRRCPRFERRWSGCEKSLNDAQLEELYELSTRCPAILAEVKGEAVH